MGAVKSYSSGEVCEGPSCEGLRPLFMPGPRDDWSASIADCPQV